ncbi:MAG: hypothetical protein JSR37_03180 [Verrucomicrobia bacterium]|nr:hypothetical protein [Verrucomicrobiota bacterium]MBS0637416.1 hypothetical protein [Verrucomicrobiota bacterium]
MSLGESLVRGAAGGLAGGVASFVAGKMLAPYAWEMIKSGASQGKDLAASALKTTAVALGAFTLAGVGYGAACWIHNKTALTGGRFDLVLQGYNEKTVETVHKYAPTATFAASCAPLAYMAVRLFI